MRKERRAGHIDSRQVQRIADGVMDVKEEAEQTEELITWQYKDASEKWYELNDLLDDSRDDAKDGDKTKGIYVIKCGRDAVYVGHGDVFKRLAEHRTELDDETDEFNAYKDETLLVTLAWMENKYHRLSAERFLAQELKPAIPKSLPVNKPSGF